MSPEEVVLTLRAAGCVFAEEEAEVLRSTATSPEQLSAMVARRVEGLPLEQVVGWADFCGLRVLLEPGVFVPRRRTEALAREAVRLALAVPGRPEVVDLCCGSGALAAVLVAQVPGARVHACDLDPVAAACARRNLPSDVPVLSGDLDGPLPESLRGRVDILTANVPYVPTGEIAMLPAEARLHEPAVTLDGGADGLSVLRRVARIAPTWLAPGGSVLCETSERQQPRAAAALSAVGLTVRVVHDDDLGATVLVGTRTPTARG